jgi:hypothetical protein
VAYHFQDILEEELASCGLKSGVIQKEPIEALLSYHYQA